MDLIKSITQEYEKENIPAFGIGDTVRVSFNVRAREYGGRWYNDLRVWRITAAGDAQAAPAAPAAPAYQAAAPAAPAYQAPAPTIDDMPIDLGVVEDDLPF